MAKLGSAITPKFDIGTAEMRLGPLTKANLLQQSDSIGLIDDATYTVNQTNVDLLGGFPKTVVDTAVTEQTATINATMREYSRRNLRILLGDGLAGTAPTEVRSTLDTAADLAAGANVVNVDTGDGALFAADDVVIIYPEGRPQDVSVLQVLSVAVDALTMKANHVTAVDYNALTESGTVFNIYVAHQVAIGNITRTNYFSVMLIQQENSTGQPKIVSFWKGSIGGSMEVATGSDDFASSAMEIKLLQPTVTDSAAGGELVDMVDLINLHPTGMFLNGHL